MAALGVHPSVLVVEDGEPEEALERRLSHFGYRVVTAANGDDALRALPDLDPDLVLLEVAGPGDDGCETLARIRSRTDAPVIMLSSRASEAQRVRGVLGGADDYLAKPMSPAEVTARVAAVLRRSPRRHADPDVFDDGTLRADRGNPDVTVRGKPVRLTPIELRLLEALIAHPGRVLSPEQLGHLVWGRLTVDAADSARLYISYLRAKIERDTARPELIETVRGRGYRYRAMASSYFARSERGATPVDMR
jgi:two-component system, OmpR family, response regulator MtrA